MSAVETLYCADSLLASFDEQFINEDLDRALLMLEG
jgi:hypothetical protein